MDKQKLFIRSYVKSLVDEGQRILSGVVGSNGIIDRAGESINPGGWSLDNYLKNPVLLWAHDYRSLPVGKALRVYVENNELKFDLQFTDTEAAIEIFNLYKEGFLNAFSVGFIPLKNDETGEYTFAEQELLELSCVPVPANPQALMGRDAEQSQIRIRSIEEKLASVLKENEETEEEKEEEEDTEETQEAENAEEETESAEDEEKGYTDDTKVSDLTVIQLKEVIQSGLKTQEEVITKEGRTLSSKHEKLLRTAKDHIETVLSSLGSEDQPQNSGEDDEGKSIEQPVNKETLQKLQTGLKKTDKSIGLVLRLLKAANAQENKNGEGVSE